MTFDDRSARAASRVEGQLRFYKMASVILLALVVLLAAVLITGSRRNARAIKIDGALACLVRDQRAAQRVHDELLAQGRGTLPGEASLEQQWSDEPWPVDGSRDVLGIREATELLGELVVVMVDAATIEVDGHPTVNLPSKEFAQDVLDTIKHQYVPEGEKLIEGQTFLEDVKITSRLARADSVLTEIAAAVEALGTTKAEAEVYTVKPGEFVEKISADHGMTVQQFYDLNPELRGNVIHPGDKVKVSRALVGITVKTVTEVSETLDVPPEVERVHTATLQRGQTRVASEGVPGKKVVTSLRTYHNARLVEEKVRDTQTIEAPTLKKVMVGTADAPPTGGASEG
jgi:LysM repeat protein